MLKDQTLKKTGTLLSPEELTLSGQTATVILPRYALLHYVFLDVEGCRKRAL